MSDYYYDSVLGFFKLDWSSDSSENVRIIWSTDECPTWYGYKLWWYAFSSTLWYIDFNYNDDIFVYYCSSDDSLHGHAYSRHLWFQSFEWIWFQVTSSITTQNNIEDTIDTLNFVNDQTDLTERNSYVWSDSNITIRDVNGDIIEIEADQESLFYIIK